MRALFAGSFDPVTYGHLDVISRFAPQVDTLVVAVAVNPDKRPLFPEAERVAMLREVCRPWPNVEVHAFQGLVVEAAQAVEATLLVRGIRNSAEFDREMQMAHVNRALTGIETLLLPASAPWAYLSATLVREVARFGGEVSPFVPDMVAARLRELFSAARQGE
jgi:pantetheine-phosphate adenylyltransferase